MANASTAAFGLKLVKLRDSGVDILPNGIPMYVPASDATALYVGDPVIRVNTGSNSAAITASNEVGDTVNYAAGTLPLVTRASAGDSAKITGVVVRVGYDPFDSSRPHYRKASTEAVVWVVTDVNAVYEAKVTNGSVAAADVGANINLAVASGDATVGRSGVSVDAATIAAADATKQMRIIGVSKDRDNQDLGAVGHNVLVMINQSTEHPVAAPGI